MLTYEQLLDRDPGWALREGSMRFEKDSAVQKTLRKIAQRLDELGIPYAIAGGMAMFYHGYRRFTEDVDIVVTREGLNEIHRQLDGLGDQFHVVVPPFAGSKQLRDAESGVRVEFLVTGGFPGDGKPKPVAFPDPQSSSVMIDGIHFLDLPKLIELKLASGMTNPGRLNDLGDVQQLIRALNLPRETADKLDPFVQGKFCDLWDAVKNNPAEPS